jgi:DNA-binding Lrp family transcriptional regulator
VAEGARQVHLDQIDLAILDLLREDARRTVTDIASRVNLSLAPVKRRIDRLERAGIIRGYTVIVDPSAVRPRIEAYSSLKLVAGDVEEVANWLQTFPEVDEIASIAGEEDLMLKLRVETVQQLHSTINTLRRDPRITGTRTLMVLDKWSPRPESA